MNRVHKLLVVSVLGLTGVVSAGHSSYAATPLAKPILKAPVLYRPVTPGGWLAADTFKEVADTVKAMVAGAHSLPYSSVSLAAVKAF